MTCREFVDFVMAYLDDELAADAQVRFERHLALCPMCVVYLETYADTVALEHLCAEPDAAVPDDVPEELVAAVLAAL